MLCNNCVNKENVPGDAHIHCKNPPSNHLEIGRGGKERYELAAKWAKEHHAVVRCVWPGSGFFPVCFDSNTVFGCSHHKVQDQDAKITNPWCDNCGSNHDPHEPCPSRIL